MEVRATEYQKGHLFIYPNDADASIFVLMNGHYPEFRTAGSIVASDAKQDQWWRPDADPACW
ncbi:hypothetical protein [Bradyrhizobium sp. USDA 10063]